MIDAKVARGCSVQDCLTHRCAVKTRVAELAGDNDRASTGANQREVGAVTGVE